MTHEMDSVEEFLSHKTSDRGGGYLGNWKKDKRINVFLHCKVRPIAIWRHGLPSVVITEKNGEATRHVWGRNYVCPEDEKVLTKQNKRDTDGSRLRPPQKCGICKMIEIVHEMVEEGTLKWTDPVFHFDADDPDEVTTLHAGGLYNAFVRRDLDKGELLELKRAGISPSEAWRENALAKMSYLFYVVDADDVEEGLRIAIETSLLGDRIKDVIADSMESAKTKDLGNPFINPFCIQWEYNDKEGLPFNEKYKARKLDRVELTPEIAEIINGERPDTSEVMRPFDQATMRAVLEQHCVIKDFPWDQAFDGAERRRDAPRAAQAPVQHPAAQVAPQAAAAPDDDMVACDNVIDQQGTECGAPMKITDPKCLKCGKVYEVEAAAPPPPPPPTIRKRSDAKKDKAAPPDKAKAPF